MRISPISLALASSPLLLTSIATPIADHHDHSHSSRDVPDAMRGRHWGQDPEGEIAKMFLSRRDEGQLSGIEVGSDAWIALYPTPEGLGVTPTTAVPQAWLDRLYAVTNSSSFPTFGPSDENDGYPTYSDGLTGADEEVCSFTYDCVAGSDLAAAPDGMFAVGFDDGPTTASPTLYAFLAENNVSATHYMIGSNIIYLTDTVKLAVAGNGHLAVHTWSHPYMTTKTNEELVAEFGWTVQIITDVTGFVPAFWRAPYGDVDNRVRMIALEVFGLRAVDWNYDTGDWAIGSDSSYTVASVEASIEGWLTGSKSPGIILLEHELNNNTVQVFMDSYPKIISNGWKIDNVASTFGLPWYANAAADNSTVHNATSIIQTQEIGNLTDYATTLFADEAAATVVSTSTTSTATGTTTGSTGNNAKSVSSSTHTGTSATATLTSSTSDARVGAVVGMGWMVAGAVGAALMV